MRGTCGWRQRWTSGSDCPNRRHPDQWQEQQRSFWICYGNWTFTQWRWHWGNLGTLQAKLEWFCSKTKKAQSCDPVGLWLFTPKPISPFVCKVAVYTHESLHASLRTGYLFNPKMTLILPFDLSSLQELPITSNLGWELICSLSDCPGADF